jgi:2-amino-4-hydroxy-6-hydroxymethyldihydropteridine diphosphokinase
VALCFVSIGSNVERDINIRSGLQALHREFGPLLLSSIYDTEPVGFSGASFLNLAAGFHTGETALSVAQSLSRIEHEHGRSRDIERFGPRTLDLDLLLYDDLVASGNGLKLPRPEIIKYAFILEPLAEIAPDLRHPGDGKYYAELWKTFGQETCGKKIAFEL